MMLMLGLLGLTLTLILSCASLEDVQRAPLTATQNNIVTADIETLTSDGSEALPYCAFFAGTCVWDSDIRYECAKGLCDASGLTGGATFISGNNMCNSSSNDDDYEKHYYLVDLSEYSSSNYYLESQVTASCTPAPTSQPSGYPSNTPSKQPSTRPTSSPSSQPNRSPSAQPSTRPTSSPSSQQTVAPTSQPSSWPLACPSSQPTVIPSPHPSSAFPPSLAPSSAIMLEFSQSVEVNTEGGCEAFSPSNEANRKVMAQSAAENMGISAEHVTFSECIAAPTQANKKSSNSYHLRASISKDPRDRSNIKELESVSIVLLIIVSLGDVPDDVANQLNDDDPVNEAANAHLLLFNKLTTAIQSEEFLATVVAVSDALGGDFTATTIVIINVITIGELHVSYPATGSPVTAPRSITTSESSTSMISDIVGVAVGAIVAIAVLGGAMYWYIEKNRKTEEGESYKMFGSKKVLPSSSSVAMEEQDPGEIEWKELDPIQYGTKLTKDHLNATLKEGNEGIEGSWTYTTKEGKLLVKGDTIDSGDNIPLIVAFQTKHGKKLSQKIVHITIKPYSPQVMWDMPQVVKDGWRSDEHLNAKLIGNGSDMKQYFGNPVYTFVHTNTTGKDKYTLEAGYLLGPGTYDLTVDFKSNNPNYNTVSGSVKLKVQGDPKKEKLIFLSHAQAEAGGIAIDLYHSFKDLGVTCWLDQYEDNVTADGMKKGVENCSVFILILTASVLERPFCQLEILTALESKKPIMLLHETDLRKDPWVYDFWRRNNIWDKKQWQWRLDLEGQYSKLAASPEGLDIRNFIEKMALVRDSFIPYRRKAFAKEAMLLEIRRRIDEELTRRLSENSMAGSKQIKWLRKQNSLLANEITFMPLFPNPIFHAVYHDASATGPRIAKELSAAVSRKGYSWTDKFNTATHIFIILSGGMLGHKSESKKNIMTILKGKIPFVFVFDDSSGWSFDSLEVKNADELIKSSFKENEAYAYRYNENLKYEHECLVSELFRSLSVYGRRRSPT